MAYRYRLKFSRSFEGYFVLKLQKVLDSSCLTSVIVRETVLHIKCSQILKQEFTVYEVRNSHNRHERKDIIVIDILLLGEFDLAELVATMKGVL